MPSLQDSEELSCIYPGFRFTTVRTCTHIFFWQVSKNNMLILYLKHTKLQAESLIYKILGLKGWKPETLGKGKQFYEAEGLGYNGLGFNSRGFQPLDFVLPP